MRETLIRNAQALASLAPPVATLTDVDGLPDVGELPLSERAGRPALSAEDLLDAALARDGFEPIFEPIAVYGAPSCPRTLVTGRDAHDKLAKSYRDEAS